ncbi:MAG: isopenicillin N synthase family oxygenase [Myxococcales bacterium]|nr:isopenicillin N synthase family oxygenase [Myxococcales bacterium]MCB9750926.1 isopenicillin N synthase family oxygenase [Myxococcales bacterium]
MTSPSSSSDRVPVLDIRLFDQPSPESRPRFVDELGAALREHGFVGLAHHGVPDELVAAAYRAAGSFFELPLAQRRRARAPREVGGNRGYTDFGIEHAKDNAAPDLKEFFQIGRERAPGTVQMRALPANVWPEEPADFRASTYALFQALEALSRRVLRAVALHLGLPEEFFADKVDHGDDVLRPIHYPPIRGAVGGSVRSAAHEDINLITLLVGSGEPGLEILSKRGDWVPVDTIPGVILCNVGDILQRLTNHALRSTTHRVVNPPAPWGARSRYSIPYFVHPNPELVIESLPQCVSATRPDRYAGQAITAGEFLRQRLVAIGLVDDDPRKGAA